MKYFIELFKTLFSYAIMIETKIYDSVVITQHIEYIHHTPII